MNSADKRKIQHHKMELDEKYLSRKLLEMAECKPVIRSNLRKYKLKFRIKNKQKILVHEKAFIRMLKINARVARLLKEKDLIKCMYISGVNIYTIADIEHFLRNNKSRYK